MLIFVSQLLIMNENIKQQIRESFQSMIPVAKNITNDFYNKLFADNPELKKLFHGNMEDQKEKFIHMISMSVQGLDNEDELVQNLKFLGRKHVNYGVKDNQYDKVKNALLWSIEKNCDGKINSEHLEAWREFYDYLASIMLEGKENG